MFTLFTILLIIQQSVIYKITKYTTIGNHIWFGEAVDSVAGKMKYNKLSEYIRKFSYGKLLSCRPCHSFWLNLMIFMTYGAFTTINYSSVFFAIFWSLLLYSTNVHYNDKA